MKRNSLVYDTVISEIELTYRPLLKVSELPIIKSSEEAYNIFVGKWDMGKLEFVEQFKALFLNRANRVIGICTITSGGINSTVLDYRILFGVALKAVASAVIIAHNHPSGNMRPSNSDMKVTQSVNEAGKLLGIELLDHLIITKEGYCSLKDDGVF